MRGGIVSTRKTVTCLSQNRYRRNGRPIDGIVRPLGAGSRTANLTPKRADAERTSRTSVDDFPPKIVHPVRRRPPRWIADSS